MIQGGEFNKILADIQNAAENKKKDKFQKKFALIVCNQTYKTKAGLENLPQTENDFENIRRTTKMMNIHDENVYELVNKDHKEL